MTRSQLYAQESRHETSADPLVSVLLPVRNDASQLRSCLAALRAQDYPANLLELVVADGRSTDATALILEDFCNSAPFRVETVDNPSGGAAAGFNTALRAAGGEIIVLLGARALPETNFISASVAALRESGADAVGGVVTGEAEGLQAEAVALALGSRFGVGDARYRYASQAGEVDTVNYGAYRREVFTEVGGFDEAMDNVEDDEFNYRLRAAGKRLYLTPTIRCRYRVRPSVLSLARQYARYGYPKVRVLLLHPRQMRARQFAPAGLVASLALTLLTSNRFALSRTLFWLIAAAYAAACSAASIGIARRRGWRYLPLLPLAFAGMHLGYGASSLVGAIRWGLLPAVFHRRRSRQVAPEVPRSADRASDSAEARA